MVHAGEVAEATRVIFVMMPVGAEHCSAPTVFGGNMKKHRIRPLAICVFRNNDRILVAEGYDPVKQQTFYRPLGGGIEFGEHSEQTIHRELMEEIGAEVRDLKYLGTLENIFVFNGTPGHEIVQVYDGVLTESGLYEQAEIEGQEADINDSFKAVWKNIHEFVEGKSTLYPVGLLALIQ
jgi:8-oxo-dGTP pyrophosphatase MutT (NUDIX family)